MNGTMGVSAYQVLRSYVNVTGSDDFNEILVLKVMNDTQCLF